MSTPQDPYENPDEFGYEDGYEYEEAPVQAETADPKDLTKSNGTVKRSSFLTSAGVYAIPVILVIGLLFWQFGGMKLINPAADPAPAVDNGATTDNSGIAVTSDPSTLPDDSAKTLPSADPFAQQPTEPVTMADGSTTPSTLAPAPGLNSDPLATSPSALATGMETPNTASAPISNEPVASTPAVPPATTEVATTTTSPASGTVSVNNHETELQQRVTMLEQQLTEAQQAAQQNRQTIDELTQKLTTAEGRLSSQDNTTSSYSSATETSKPAKKKVTAKKKPAIEGKISGRYTLRAVGNGNAWVSEGSSDDLQQVKVGDTLSGIGKVKSITLKNGAWVIEGSQGSIR